MRRVANPMGVPLLAGCLWAVGLQPARAQFPGGTNAEPPAAGAPASTALEPPRRVERDQPVVLGSEVPPSQVRSRTILSAEVRPIDLNTALRLAGVQNPEVLIARQRVLEAVAQRQLAAAQF